MQFLLALLGFIVFTRGKCLSNNWITDTSSLGLPIIKDNYVQLGDITMDNVVNATTSVHQDFDFVDCKSRLTFEFSGSTKDNSQNNDFQAVCIKDALTDKTLVPLFKTLYGFNMVNDPIWIFQTYNLCDLGLHSKIGTRIRIQFLVQGNGNNRGTTMFIRNVCLQ